MQQNAPTGQQGQVRVPAVAQQQVARGQQVLRKFSNPQKKNVFIPVLLVILVVLAGVGTGWFLSGGALAGKTAIPRGENAPGVEESNGEAGVSDESTFNNTAEGKLEKGGIEGDGTHRLIRGADPSKYIALTSTVIDLDSFVGKEVQIWGQTLAAQKAPWLMDVGKIKIIK